ncbi:hypothetical protein MTER_04850 [Mycolicibacter terrae]|jgi:hypothetical protein|uniref:Alanine and proline rich membrane protein n=1 Tax=Mycolicibacter terrae TaxID=1788 RepID=A0AAD1MGK1_9MYCO|nr:hypothetical protein [Mycolicibacter terrae]ORW90701.1 hypothetical protein AWC28_02585 [Mycolicibacter terrae]BBX21074.1 hypothetical protein MTER_04850 [Mycolicibacter terrae]SNV91931.1 Conserved membrane protein of uncharacterised function, alanine and proline rich protein [Mycolicibacter terrae]
MSDQSQPDSAESATQEHPTDQAEAPKRPAPKTPAVTAPATPGWRPVVAAAAVALVAGALGGAGVAAFWHPGSEASAKSSGQHAADATKDVCSAAVLARQAVANNMHLKNPDPQNPVAQLAVAANARLSLTAGAAYLRGRLEANPAAPQDVVKAANAMAGELEHLNLSYLVGQPNSDREQLGRDLDARIAELGKLCQ